MKKNRDSDHGLNIPSDRGHAALCGAFLFRKITSLLFCKERPLSSGAPGVHLSRGPLIVLSLLMLAFTPCPAFALDELESPAKASPGSTAVPSGVKELSVPYAFYNDSFGAAAGYVYGLSGYPQPQATVIATAIVGSNSAAAFYLLTRDIRMPYMERLYVDTDLALSTFGTIQSYVNGNPAFPNERAGSNNSDKDNYVEGDGKDNLVRATFRYLLPIGGGKEGLKPPVLVGGLPVQREDQEFSWDPLKSGKTFIEVKPYWREQTIDGDEGTFDQKTNGGAFSLYRDNTDFWKNPSTGSSMRARYTQDWGWFNSSQPYYVGDFEYSKYISLGESDKYRKRVIALDFWTSNAFSWDRTTTQDGDIVNERPPAYLGSTLGGLWRMRGYPTSRFNDQAAVYYAAEYRVTPVWNPFTKIEWLQKRLGIEWWQWVTFVEMGRVAPVWTVEDLHSSMKWDMGFGVRAMAKGIVARVDLAASEEGFAVNMMVGQPFQF